MSELPGDLDPDEPLQNRLLERGMNGDAGSSSSTIASRRDLIEHGIGDLNMDTGMTLNYNHQDGTPRIDRRNWARDLAAIEPSIIHQSQSLRFDTALTGTSISQDRGDIVYLIEISLEHQEQACMNAVENTSSSEYLNPSTWNNLIARFEQLFWIHKLLQCMMNVATASSDHLAQLASTLPARMWRHGIHSLIVALQHHEGYRKYLIDFTDFAYRQLYHFYRSYGRQAHTWAFGLYRLAEFRSTIDEDTLRSRWLGTARVWQERREVLLLNSLEEGRSIVMSTPDLAGHWPEGERLQDAVPAYIRELEVQDPVSRRSGMSTTMSAIQDMPGAGSLQALPSDTNASSSPVSRRRHSQRTRNSSTITPVQCQYCLRTTSRPDNLLRHLRQYCQQIPPEIREQLNRQLAEHRQRRSSNRQRQPSPSAVLASIIMQDDAVATSTIPDMLEMFDYTELDLESQPNLTFDGSNPYTTSF